MGLPGWLSGKESAYNAGASGDIGSTSGSGRSPGGGHGKPLQYSCLQNPVDRGAWQATVHSVAKSQTQLKQLSIHASFQGTTNSTDLRKNRLISELPKLVQSGKLRQRVSGTGK